MCEECDPEGIRWYREMGECEICGRWWWYEEK